MSDKQFLSWEAAVEWLRTQPGQGELVHACYYDQPMEKAAHRYYSSPEWAEIRKLLPTTSGAVLDIGAGHGIASYALAMDGWRVTALEPDPSDQVGAGAIRRLAQEKRLAIEVVQEFGERIPFADEIFDVVFARQALHHARDLRQLCREMARVLKPGGRLVTVRDHVISKPADLPRFLAAHPLHHLYGGEQAFLLKEYRHAFAAANLGLRRVIRPLDSVINFAPLDDAGLREELARQVGGLPVVGGAAAVLLRSSPTAYRAVLALLKHVDQRPGRAYSFVCEKVSRG